MASLPDMDEHVVGGPLHAHQEALCGTARRIEGHFSVLQPFDAAAAAMDGGLLGASETAYASRAALCVAFGVWCLLQVLPRSLPGLVGIWLSLKGLSVGRTLAATYRLTSSKSPLSKQAPLAAAASRPSGNATPSDDGSEGMPH